MAPNYVRKITFFKDKIRTHAMVQAEYMNMATGWLIPNTKIYSGDELDFRINSLGCKGPEIYENIPTIGYFGDSGSFGGRTCWPDIVDVPGTQNLNASVEGHSMNRVIEQFLRLKGGGIDLIAGVFYTGWHNLVYSENSETYWREQLDQIEGLDVVALCTPHCCLTVEHLERGLDDLIDNNSFGFFGNLERTDKKMVEIYDAIARFHKFLESYCKESDYIFIDIDAVVKPAHYDDTLNWYNDICHVRPDKFQAIGACVTDAINKKIQAAQKKRQANSSEENERVGLSHDTVPVKLEISDDLAGFFSDNWKNERIVGVRPSGNEITALKKKIEFLEKLLSDMETIVEAHESSITRLQNLYTNMLRQQLEHNGTIL